MYVNIQILFFSHMQLKSYMYQIKVNASNLVTIVQCMFVEYHKEQKLLSKPKNSIIQNETLPREAYINIEPHEYPYGHDRPTTRVLSDRTRMVGIIYMFT